MQYIAHTSPFGPSETLSRHLEQVAALAADFAGKFDAAEWGRLAGAWHDLGKMQPAFQDYIQGRSPQGPPHAWTGAVLALLRDKTLLPIAAAIAAHHGALANIRGDEAAGRPVISSLDFAMRSRFGDFQALRNTLPRSCWEGDVPSLPTQFQKSAAPMICLELFTRFLYSALIDADRTATARYRAQYEPLLTADDLRYDDIAMLRDRLDAAIDGMQPRGSNAVVQLRKSVLAACRQHAGHTPGRFSLTVPTGGGKTLSAMSFALNHALHHGLRRVIVVIPYTSIIEQSARVYRNVLNDTAHPEVQNVLEHHSNLDEQKLTEQDPRAEQLRQLAAENWDSPVIVTTTLQFFESLLGNHGSRCRKIHNIARSVVILDEVQTLPPQFLSTVINVLGQLTDHYHCSVLLATATPPALVGVGGTVRPHLTNVTEIMLDPVAAAEAARRVQIEWRTDAPTPYSELAAELRRLPRALAVVHRRDDARILVEQLGDEALHLSAAMCPAHRMTVLAEVRRRLSANESCRLVSTQLIEAGVDVDFPVVYRALAGLDSIAQCAGRCDREGLLTAAAGFPAGKMIVFRAESSPPPGVPRKALESMYSLRQIGPIDPFNPDDCRRYFDDLYRKVDLDQHQIEMLRAELAFAAVAEKFRIIDQPMHPVIVPYGDGPARLAAFLKSPTRQTVRALQPFIVQVSIFARDRLRAAGIIMPIDDEYQRFDILCEGRHVAYHPQFGLDDRVDPSSSADALVV